MKHVLGGAVALSLLMAGDAMAIKVIGRNAPALEAPPPKPVKSVKARPPAATKAPRAPKVTGPTDALTPGQVCALEKPLKAKVYKLQKTLPSTSLVTVLSLQKTEAVVLTNLGDARVKRKALAEVCGTPPTAPPPVVVAVVPEPVTQPVIAAIAPPPPPPPVKEEPPVVITKVPDPVVAYDPEPERIRMLSRARTKRALAWTFTVVGVAGIAGGATVFALNQQNATRVRADIVAYNSGVVLTNAEHDRLEGPRQQIRTFDIITGVAGGVGLAALVTGIVLFASGDSPSQYEAKTSTSVSFMPTLGGFQLSGAF